MTAPKEQQALLAHTIQKWRDESFWPSEFSAQSFYLTKSELDILTRALSATQQPGEQVGPLVDFFRGPGYQPFGHTGDYEGWSPEQTAVHFLTEYLKVLRPPEWPVQQPATPNELLRLIDIVWQEAREDKTVPASEWAKRMIQRAGIVPVQQPAAGQVEAVARAIFARRYPGAPFGPDVMCKGDDGTEIVAWEWLCGKDARAALAASQPDRLREGLEEIAKMAESHSYQCCDVARQYPYTSIAAQKYRDLADEAELIAVSLFALLNPEQSAQVTL